MAETVPPSANYNSGMTCERNIMTPVAFLLVSVVLSGCATIAPDRTQQAQKLVFLKAEDRGTCELLDTYLGPAERLPLVKSREKSLNLPLNQLAELGANSVYVVEDGSSDSGVIVEGYLCTEPAAVVQADPTVNTHSEAGDQSSTEKNKISLKAVSEPVSAAKESGVVAVPAPALSAPKVEPQSDLPLTSGSVEDDQPNDKKLELTSVPVTDSTATVKDISVGKVRVSPDASSGTTTSFAEFERLLASGQKGNAEAQYQLGLAYQRGDHVDPSRTLAVLWFASAAHQGHKEAEQKISPDCPLEDLGARLGPDTSIGDCLVSSVDPLKKSSPSATQSDRELLTNLVGKYEGTAREILGSESQFKLEFYLVSSERIVGRLEDTSGYHEELSDIVRIDPESWAVYGLSEADCELEKICVRMKWASRVSTHTGFTWLQFEPDFNRYEGIVMHGGKAALEISGRRVFMN